jgi:hypothetical protein
VTTGIETGPAVPTLVTTETVSKRTRETFGRLDYFRRQGLFGVKFLDGGLEIEI